MSGEIGFRKTVIGWAARVSKVYVFNVALSPLIKTPGEVEEAEGRLQTQFKQSSKFIDFPGWKVNSYR